MAPAGGDNVERSEIARRVAKDPFEIELVSQEAAGGPEQPCVLPGRRHFGLAMAADARMI